MSERTLLPVVLQAKEIHTLAARLTVAIEEVLLALGVPSRLAERERAEMREFHFGRTENKRVLGSLNDFMFNLSYTLDMHPNQPLLERSLFLAEAPCKPIGYNSPDRATLELFASESVGAPAIQ